MPLLTWLPHFIHCVSLPCFPSARWYLLEVHVPQSWQVYWGNWVLWLLIMLIKSIFSSFFQYSKEQKLWINQAWKRATFLLVEEKMLRTVFPPTMKISLPQDPSIHVLSFTSTICYSAVFIKRLVGDRLCARYWGSIQK